MSASLGYIHKFLENDGSSLLSKAVATAFSKGILVVVSAGILIVFLKTSLSTGNYGITGISIPADAKNVLSVGSIDSSFVKSSFSSLGPSADGRVKPEVKFQFDDSLTI